MGEISNQRASIAIVAGIFCVLVGLMQFLYSFLAFTSVIVVDILGVGLTLLTSAFAAVPEEPYEIPYARALAKLIAVSGMAFSIVVFVSGCRFFYRHQVSRVGLVVCGVFGFSLAVLHFANSLSYAAMLYLGVTVIFLGLLSLDWLVGAPGGTRESKAAGDRESIR